MTFALALYQVDLLEALVSVRARNLLCSKVEVNLHWLRLNCQVSILVISHWTNPLRSTICSGFRKQAAV